MDEPAAQLFAAVERTTDKLRPLTADATKVAGEFGRELVKACVTLNGGGLIAFPALFKAIASEAAVTTGFYLACGSFALGVAVGAFAMVTAFGLLVRTLRSTVYATMLPMLQAQNYLAPRTMDENQRKRLIKAERASQTVEHDSIAAVLIFGLLCATSVVLFIAGGVFGGFAILAAHH